MGAAISRLEPTAARAHPDITGGYLIDQMPDSASSTTKADVNEALSALRLAMAPLSDPIERRITRCAPLWKMGWWLALRDAAVSRRAR